MKQELSTVAIDLAKKVFHLVGTDTTGNILWRKRLSRNALMPFIAQLPPVLIGMEACGGAHYWARRFREHGHDVKLMAPQFVKAYVKSNKNDTRDAEAIAEAVTRPTMRFVPVKDVEQQDIQALHRGAYLHDLGKIAVPEDILDKPATLSDVEWQAIGEHPRIGQVILEQASNLREAIPVVLHHHERYNGGGYPHGLRGNEIPLGARILCLVDYFDALTSDRPYHKAMDIESAVALIQQEAGKALDPSAVAAFVRILPEIRAEAQTADLVLEKSGDHSVRAVRLRKL